MQLVGHLNNKEMQQILVRAHDSNFIAKGKFILLFEGVSNEAGFFLNNMKKLVCSCNSIY